MCCAETTAIRGSGYAASSVTVCILLTLPILNAGGAAGEPNFLVGCSPCGVALEEVWTRTQGNMEEAVGASQALGHAGWCVC